VTEGAGPTKERPILFSAAMVRAILAGRKTQTRRIVTPQPRLHHYLQPMWGTSPPPNPVEFGDKHLWREVGPDYPDDERDDRRCPYGVPGDRLWVREEHYRFGHWERATGRQKRTRTGRQRWRFVADTDEVRFDAPTEFRKGRHHRDSSTPAWHKRLARFMPRALSRMSLEVTEVRAQRLPEISEDDARAEGVERDTSPCDHTRLSCADIGCLGQTHRSAFAELWNGINETRAPWSSNPWVWAVTFRRVE